MLNTTNAIGSQQATEFCNPSNQGYTPLGVHSKKDISKDAKDNKPFPMNLEACLPTMLQKILVFGGKSLQKLDICQQLQGLKAESLTLGDACLLLKHLSEINKFLGEKDTKLLVGEILKFPIPAIVKREVLKGKNLPDPISIQIRLAAEKIKKKKRRRTILRSGRH